MPATPSSHNRIAALELHRTRPGTILAALAALTLLPVLGLAAFAFAGGIDGTGLQSLTPAVMLLPALATVIVWSITRPEPLGSALRLRAERGWRRSLGWSVLALGIIGVLGIATAGIAVLLGVAQPNVDWAAVLPALPVAVVTALAFALAEEVAWRGWAQRLLAPAGLVRSSLVIAGFWATWHAPALAVWVVEGSMPLPVALVTLGGLVPGGLVLSALAALGGSVWPAAVGHAAMNTLVVVATSTLVTGDATAIGLLGWLPWALAALVLLALAARSLRAARGQRNETTGASCSPALGSGAVGEESPGGRHHRGRRRVERRLHHRDEVG